MLLVFQTHFVLLSPTILKNRLSGHLTDRKLEFLSGIAVYPIKGSIDMRGNFTHFVVLDRVDNFKISICFSFAALR